MTMKEFTEVELKFEAQVRSMYDRLLVKLSIERIFYESTFDYAIIMIISEDHA